LIIVPCIKATKGTLQTCQFWYYLIRAGSLGFRAWQGKRLTGALGHG
jgi:hypothetical protein